MESVSESESVGGNKPLVEYWAGKNATQALSFWSILQDDWYSFFSFINFYRTWVLFVGPLILLFWTSSVVSSGVTTWWPFGGQHCSQAVLFRIPANRHWWSSKPYDWYSSFTFKQLRCTNRSWGKSGNVSLFTSGFVWYFCKLLLSLDTGLSRMKLLAYHRLFSPMNSLVSTYVVCERLSVMHEPAGVVENLCKFYRIPLFRNTEYPPPGNWNLGRSWDFEYFQLQNTLPQKLKFRQILGL